MRPLIIAGAAAIAALTASAALAGQPSYPENAQPPVTNGQYDNQAPPSAPDYDNSQANQDYQSSMNAYNAARDTAARADEDYNVKSDEYRADRRAYHHQLWEYRRARDDYDAEYGPGAYERFYAPPPPPPYD